MSAAPRRMLVIGIGAGDPDLMTVQAIRALQRVDVFFAPDKGEEKEDLAELRHEICRRFREGQSSRFVRFPDPPRETDMPYRTAVDAWHGKRAELYARAIAGELEPGQTGGILAWGDPTLYDSTLRILEAIHSRGELALEIEVIPGISSVQLLAARHRIALNRIGESVHVTTGRKLAAGYPADADSVVVMLDGSCAFQEHVERDLDIYWGAYLGTKDEILVSGPLQDVSGRIVTLRSEARRRKGWIMDIYLLRPSERT
jgi:precorrin-6A synthase